MPRFLTVPISPRSDTESGHGDHSHRGANMFHESKEKDSHQCPSQPPRPKAGGWVALVGGWYEGGFKVLCLKNLED